MPEKSRADLTTELEASIGDAIDARVDAGEPRDDAERAVLTDLGDPDKLAADYTDRPTFLVGPRYYFEWWRLLKLLLWIVPACAAFGIALGQVLSGAPTGTVIGSTVVGVLGVIVHIGFWVTLVFAILERSVDGRPTAGRRAGAVGDLDASIACPSSARRAWASPTWSPRSSSSRSRPSPSSGTASSASCWTGDERMPVLNPDLWPWWIAGALRRHDRRGVMAIAIYRKGRWTPGFAVLNTVLALAVAVPAIWLLAERPAAQPGVLHDGHPRGLLGGGLRHRLRRSPDSASRSSPDGTSSTAS